MNVARGSSRGARPFISAPAKDRTNERTDMTMWLLNRKDENENKVNIAEMSKPRGLSKWRKKLASPRGGLDKDAMHMAETYSGIEVSLSNEESSNRGEEEVRTTSSTPTDTSFSTVISLKDQIDDLQRTCLIQFCIPRPEAPMDLPTSPTNSPAVSFKNSTRHRLPLFRANGASDQIKRGHDIVMQLLRKSPPTNELALLKQEISLLDDELTFMNSDRDELEKCMIPPPSPTSISELELHRTLNATGPQKLAPHRRAQLQNERGVNLTVRIGNVKALDALLSKCAYKSHSPIRSSISSPKKGSSTTSQIMTINPHNCRDGGAAATIQHLSLLKLPGIKEGTGIFLSRDNGKAHASSSLPDRLQRRFKAANLDGTKDLLYLSVGPHSGYYYAELRNGACWWGSAAVDHEFDKCCSQWDVHRVVFGPCTFFDIGTTSKMIPSWIILSKDGKVAWKNIPSRLQSQLMHRNGDLAPTEVSLGSNGSYFIRYLDGTFCENSGFLLNQLQDPWIGNCQQTFRMYVNRWKRKGEPSCLSTCIQKSRKTL